MKKIASLIISFLFVLTLAAQAEELSQVRSFHSATTGRGAGTSPIFMKFEEQRLRGVEARPVFLRCLQKGTPAARLYGAWGLYELNKEEGLAALRTLLEDEESVPFMKGCLLGDSTVGAEAESLLENFTKR